jgi:hypothetical protein
VDCVSHAAIRYSGFVVERLHLLEGKLVSENLIASFPFDWFLVVDFDPPTTAPVAHEHLAVRHCVRLLPDSKPVTTRADPCDVKPHAGRERLENTLESSIQIVDRSL